MISRGAFIKAIAALPFVGSVTRKPPAPIVGTNAVVKIGDTVEIRHALGSDERWVTSITTARGALSIEEMRALPPSWTNPTLLFRK